MPCCAAVGLADWARGVTPGMPCCAVCGSADWNRGVAPGMPCCAAFGSADWARGVTPGMPCWGTVGLAGWSRGVGDCAHVGVALMASSNEVQTSALFIVARSLPQRGRQESPFRYPRPPGPRTPPGVVAPGGARSSRGACSCVMARDGSLTFQHFYARRGGRHEGRGEAGEAGAGAAEPRGPLPHERLGRALRLALLRAE